MVLIEGAGLAADNLPRAVQDPDKVLRQAGAVLQASVAGLRALLIARNLVKREFRIEQTLLSSKDNNPLKFAASDEVALASLLDDRTESLRVVQQAIDDLTEHEVAVMSSTQAAARAMLERLSPAALEAEDPGGGMLPGAQEKRLWAAYKRRYAQLVAQLEDDFDSAFGTAFARAYEQAVNAGGRR
jgi:type VI secretion system FHA domain protein